MWRGTSFVVCVFLGYPFWAADSESLSRQIFECSWDYTSLELLKLRNSFVLEFREREERDTTLLVRYSSADTIVFTLLEEKIRNMVRTRPSGEAFGSNRRSPTLMRRRREEINAARDAASSQSSEEDTSPSRSLSSSPTHRWITLPRGSFHLGKTPHILHLLCC